MNKDTFKKNMKNITNGIIKVKEQCYITQICNPEDLWATKWSPRLSKPSADSVDCGTNKHLSNVSFPLKLFCDHLGAVQYENLIIVTATPKTRNMLLYTVNYTGHGGEVENVTHTLRVGGRVKNRFSHFIELRVYWTAPYAIAEIIWICEIF